MTASYLRTWAWLALDGVVPAALRGTAATGSTWWPGERPGWSGVGASRGCTIRRLKHKKNNQISDIGQVFDEDDLNWAHIEALN